MHYYVDGYNLLFRKLTEDRFSDQRQKLIEELNSKAQLLNLDITLVFDGTFRVGESSRAHFQHLEILFSAEGETADDLILEEIKTDRHSKQKTVVTSDRKLAWFARRCSAKTESVSQFMQWLDKRYKNKLRSKPKPVKTVKEQAKKAILSEEIAHPATQASPEDCFGYYLELFQANVEKESTNIDLQAVQPAKKKRFSKKKSPTAKQVTFSEHERWLGLFQKRLEEENNL